MKKPKGLYLASGKPSYAGLKSFISGHSRWLLLMDDNSRRHCRKWFASKVSLPPTLEFVLAPGEKSKSLENAGKIISLMMEHGFDRNSLVVNLGGGVVTDMGGFIAAIYMRGIRYCNIPSTLLCMADAAIGGKTGVNIKGVKNQAGSFHQPSLVMVDTQYLKSLPEDELRSGFAEVIKHALIGGGKLWQRVSKMETLDARSVTEDLIRDSILIKNGIVDGDPTEKDRRRILNLGHTFGHALESHFINLKNAISHGHAVAEGIQLENILSVILGYLSEKDMMAIHQFLRRFYKSLHLDEKSRTSVMDLMKFDKKNHAGKIRFTLLGAIGNAVTGIEANDDTIKEAIGLYRKFG